MKVLDWTELFLASVVFSIAFNMKCIIIIIIIITEWLCLLYRR